MTRIEALARFDLYLFQLIHNCSFCFNFIFFQLIHKWRPVDVCCKGYSPGAPGSGPSSSPSNGTALCLPDCPQRCHRGKCVEPDVCECEPGYGGPACSKCEYAV